ncbi:universal stress protein [Pontibacillus yanchengensis]|uniref:Phosphate starvation protein n=1 Tax=Pontibacillus yanchengensis Y32 TaxID=1385514 RepID=A0A0A2TSB2_9BACI|nr:universal stress protein [Pontibacillus yanchengensis]KGP72150.1 phosphate starvation protein [Pontibacillus yanchengensis Y32]
MQKILVAYDGSALSKQALQEARKKAEEFHADVHIITVINPTGPFTNKAVYKSIEEDLVNESRLELEKVESEFHGFTENITTEVLVGNAGAEICKYAKQHDIELIIIGSRGLGNVKELFLGSVSHNVVQHSHCPVLVIK